MHRVVKNNNKKKIFKAKPSRVVNSFQLLFRWTGNTLYKNWNETNCIFSKQKHPLIRKYRSQKKLINKKCGSNKTNQKYEKVAIIMKNWLSNMFSFCFVLSNITENYTNCNIIRFLQSLNIHLMHLVHNIQC
jgi:hypothetical protein